MIYDHIDRAELYFDVNERITAALRFLKGQDMTSLAAGRHDIRGDQIFALVQDYQTKPDADVKWEAHRKYIDVQFVAAGREQMGVTDVANVKVTQPYSDDNDALLGTGEGDRVTLAAGQFIVLFPDDAHRPCIAVDGTEAVRKVVVKVAV